MNGWLSPEGKFYSTFNLLSHYKKAEEIADWNEISFNIIDPLTNTHPWCAERLLEVLGWIKLGSDERIIDLDIDDLTDKQIKFLLKHKLV